MQLATIDASQTMSSRQIAELCEKHHHHVISTITYLRKEGCLDGRETPYTHPQNGQKYVEWLFDRDNSIVLVARLEPKFMKAIIDRWQELEAKQATEVFKVPQTLSEALRLAADQQDTIVAQAAQLALAAPAVAFVEKFVEAKSSKCLSDVAKILGKKPQAFISQLSEDHVIFKRNGSWIPYQSQLDAGRFTVKTGASSGHAYEQTRVEPKGIEWLARVYSE